MSTEENKGHIWETGSEADICGGYLEQCSKCGMYKEFEFEDEESERFQKECKEKIREF